MEESNEQSAGKKGKRTVITWRGWACLITLVLSLLAGPVATICWPHILANRPELALKIVLAFKFFLFVGDLRLWPEEATRIILIFQVVGFAATWALYGIVVFLLRGFMRPQLSGILRSILVASLVLLFAFVFNEFCRVNKELYTELGIGTGSKESHEPPERNAAAAMLAVPLTAVRIYVGGLMAVAILGFYIFLGISTAAILILYFLLAAIIRWNYSKVLSTTARLETILLTATYCFQRS